MSIRLRLTAWYAALLVGTLAVTAAIAVLAFQRTSEAQLDAELSERARLVIASTHAAAAGGPLVPGDALHDGRAADTVVFLFDPGGSLAAASTTAPAIERAARDLAVRTDAPPFATVQAAGEPLRLHLTTIQENGAVRGLLVVGRPLAPLQGAVRQLVATLLLLLPLPLGLAIAGGYLLARHALAPIERLRRSADEIAALDVPRRLAVRVPNDEIGRLAMTLDRMLARISDSVEHERRFTADASHELRNPVAAILAEAEVASSRPRDAEAYRQALVRIGEEATGMGRLVDQLLALSRADGGVLVGVPQPVDLQEIVERSRRRAAAWAEACGVSLAARPGPPAVISGDRDALARALDNLVDNAIRHSPAGGAVDLAVEAGPQLTSVRVCDQGPGFGVSELPQVFERFRRGRGAAGPGAGLGLAIVRSIVEAHGGSATAGNRAGGGAQVTLVFPAGRPPPRSAEASAAS